MAADPLIKEIFIDASPSVFFQFLTDPEKMIRWMGIKVEIDPRPGDVYRVEPNGKDIIRGKYIEIVPDSRWLASLQKPSIISAELDKEHTGA